MAHSPNEPVKAGQDKAKSTSNLFYVGIGASAGGLEAIQSFLQNLPPVNSMAFIIIQHLSPDYKSLMVELLSKKTKLPVFRAEDAMTVAPGSIYLIPPKKNLTIFHGSLILSDQDKTRTINLPIDIFLRSLAQDQGEKAAGIILSGTGSDGMRGIRSIKENGGLVIVQDEKTAKFNGMPRAAISTGIADFILPPDQMPDRLISYVKHPCMTRGERQESVIEQESGLNKTLSLLREKFKVDFTYYKPTTIFRRIERRMAFNQINDIREYADFLVTIPGEAATLYRELLIGVTSFFRDPDVFARLSQKWLPKLLNDPSQNAFRFWVVGCSTGEEAYSLAIATKECLEQMGVQKDIKIFATDIDQNALSIAGQGVFPESIAADITPKLLSKYFYRKDENFHVARAIRETVVFARHNILKDPPFTKIDLISCRNLLIYLQITPQQMIFNLFNFSLKPGGVMMLGLSETVGEQAHYFHTLDAKLKIYQSKGKASHPLDQQKGLYAKSSPGSDTADHFKNDPDNFLFAHSGRRKEDDTLNRFVEALCPDYIPVSVIVDKSLQVQHTIGDTTGLFTLPSGKLINDLSKMVPKELSVPLSTTVQKAFKTRKPHGFSDIKVNIQGQQSIFHIAVRPLPQKSYQNHLAAVLIEREKHLTQNIKTETDQNNLSQEAEKYIHELENELQYTKENLQATIEELETSNEELQATNEELLASNEELQATNEELQSTNEELHTVNVEYQNKIIELTESNNDIDNLLTGTQVGFLLLDGNLEIRKFSKYIQTVIKVLDSDVGRPLTHLTHDFINLNLVTEVQNVMMSQKDMVIEALTVDGRSFLIKIRPYQVGPNIYSGTMLSFVDMTSQKQMLSEHQSRQLQLDGIEAMSNIGSWELKIPENQLTLSDKIFEIFEIDRKEFGGTFDAFIDLVHPEEREAVKSAYLKSLEEKTPYISEYRIDLGKGRIKHIRAFCRTRYDKQGTPLVSIGVLEDFSEQKNSKNELMESWSRYSQLFDAMGEGVAVYRALDDGKDFEILELNSAAEQINNIQKHAVIGKRVTDVFPGIQELGLLGGLQRVWKTGEPEILPAVRYSNSQISGWQENQVYRLPSKKVVAIFRHVAAPETPSDL